MLKSWIFLSALAILAAGCVTGAGVRYGSRGVAGDLYLYDYYPESEVYYSASRHTYYYQDHNQWTTAASVPPGRMSGAPVHMEIRDEEPYKMHAEHRQHYPPSHPQEHSY